ncbi:MAG: FAD-dependent oxidoreductase [Anaerovorax sp.]
MNKKIVIIGGVAGGASAAARLRRLDECLEIILLERGGYISYANCGLPYYIGDVIKERDSLLLQTPEAMNEKFNIDVRINNEVLSIQPVEKQVLVKNTISGETYSESYDTLLLSTGSSPLKPPIPGIDGPGIYTLWTIPDTDKIKSFITEKKPKRAAVIGGGFIGLEMAENLHAAGAHVTVIEAQQQVMAPIDFEMAQLLHENMEMNQVDLLLGDGVSTFTSKEDVTTITLQSGKQIEADLVILSIGVRPNSQLAKEAGLALNAKGGVIVDKNLMTTDPHIYAVGDVIEVEEFISKKRTMVPLAGPANKQGRMVANNIARSYGLLDESKFGKTWESYNGTQGTSVAQVFDLTVACTGANEKTLALWGKEKNKDYFVALINQKSHAGYYPDATQLTLKLIFGKDGKIFGAQAIGQDGVDKRIDTIAVTLRLGGTVHDLAQLELAYAPPYSSAKDPVNMAGFVAKNILESLVSFASWDALETLSHEIDEKNVVILDVSEDFERMAFAMPNSYHIPLGQLRSRIHELDPNKLIIPYCAIGVRSYNASRILAGAGFRHVQVYPGGASFYKSTHYNSLSKASGCSFDADFQQNDGMGSREENSAEIPPLPRSLKPIDLDHIEAKLQVNCSGLQCPGPIMKVYHTINEINHGDIIEVSATDMGFARDIESWCRRTKNTLLKTERRGKENVVYIQKGVSNGTQRGKTPETKGNSVGSAIDKEQAPQTLEVPQGKTMVVFSGDLDKVLASFIIANGAASMGRPVTMFFTFWGLNALRKPEKSKVKKPLIDALFGKMMPRGMEKLKLSNMNMAGMGTAMMKKVMKDKNVNSLPQLMEQAMKSGIKLVACTMSMDVMGITKEELLDGVELGGVAAYLGDAEESNVNLFI